MITMLSYIRMAQCVVGPQQVTIAFLSVQYVETRAMVCSSLGNRAENNYVWTSLKCRSEVLLECSASQLWNVEAVSLWA